MAKGYAAPTFSSTMKARNKADRTGTSSRCGRAASIPYDIDVRRFRGAGAGAGAGVGSRRSSVSSLSDRIGGGPPLSRRGSIVPSGTSGTPVGPRDAAPAALEARPDRSCVEAKRPKESPVGPAVSDSTSVPSAAATVFTGGYGRAVIGGGSERAPKAAGFTGGAEAVHVHEFKTECAEANTRVGAPKLTGDALLEADERFAVSVARETEMETMLTPCQRNALKFVAESAKRLSEAAYPKLVKRCRRLGYTPQDVDATLRFIRLEAPIIVHVDLDTVLEPLTRDRYLRNQFETKTSKGALDKDHRSRIEWERRMFKSSYDDADGYERPRYGALNVTKDVRGVAQCLPYGDSYLVLGANIRFRSTFCTCDSSSLLSSAELGTCDYYAHVLYSYTDIELRATIDVATGRAPNGFLRSERHLATYKEVQITGPVRLDRDVEAIYVHRRHARHPSCVDLVKLFAAQNKCPAFWIP